METIKDKIVNPAALDFISFQGVNFAEHKSKIRWDIDISDFLKGVTSGVYPLGNTEVDIRKIIKKVHYYEKGKDPEYDEAKEQLPAVCVHGHFKPVKDYPKGRRIGTPSRYTKVVAIDIDIDDLDKIAEAKSKVIDCLGKHAFVIALSPGGRSLHVYLYAEVKAKKDIAQIQKNVAQILGGDIGKKVDLVTKDLVRVLFLTWDPDAYTNEAPTPYKIPTTGTLLEPTDEFHDIESYMVKKKMLGNVRYTDNKIWPAFKLLAGRFDREYVDRYLDERREILFHPDSNTVDKVDLIKTNLDNAYKEAKKQQDKFKDYFLMDDGIHRTIENSLEKKEVVSVRSNLFFMEYGRESIFKLTKYRAFGHYPNNYPNNIDVEFTPVPEGIYNKYYPLKHQPVPGSWDNIRCIFEHLFTNQVEYLYDYTKLLLTNPSQILPILVLISPKRDTGKTTFLHLMNEIFNPNGKIVSPPEFSTRFNDSYINKELVLIDELKLDREGLEKIKCFSTSTGESVSPEGKNISITEVKSYLHFILSSNNLDFTYIDKEENRFWVFEVTVPKAVNLDVGKKARREIPQFINYLLHEHKMVAPKSQSRAWLPYDITTTYFKSALYEKVKHNSIIQLNNRCRSLFAEEEDLKEIRFSAEDVYRFYNVRMSRPAFKGLLMGEDWIGQCETRLQYHLNFLIGLPEEIPISTDLSARNDRRRDLLYVKRTDIIND